MDRNAIAGAIRTGFRELAAGKSGRAALDLRRLAAAFESVAKVAAEASARAMTPGPAGKSVRGPKGKRGRPGKDGADAPPVDLAAVAALVPKPKDGEPGEKGDRGKPGKDGLTPVRGKHYWTKKDIRDIVAAAAKIVPAPKKGRDYFTAAELAAVEARVERAVAAKVRVSVSDRHFARSDEVRALEASVAALASTQEGDRKLQAERLSELAASLLSKPALIARALETLKGKDRLSAKALKDTGMFYGGGGGGGGITSVSWGQVVGTLANQLDLQAALDLKADVADLGAAAFSNDYGDLDNLPSIPTQYTDEMAQDAVGGILSAEFTYDDGGPGISVAAIAASKIGSLTERSIPFADSAGKLTESNQNLRFDPATGDLDLALSLASEKVTNGNMSSGSGWTQGSPWSITGGKATHASNGTGALSQNVSCRIGERYVLSITVLDWTVGTLTILCGGVTLTSTLGANGTYTFRFRATTTGTLSITATNTARLSVDDVSVKKLQGGVLNVAGRTWMGERLNIVLDASNSGPGTTDHVTLENPTGGNTHLAFSFGNAVRASFSISSNGNIVYRSGTGSSGYHEWQVNGVMVMQLTANGIYDTGYMVAGGYVNANHTGASKSELNVKGRFARLYKYTDAAPYTIPSTQGLNQGVYYFDTSLASGCQGTITYACSHWTNETDCELRDSHGGCTWNAGNPCSNFNGDQGSCEGQSPCVWESVSCSGAGDQSSCEAQDDAYGGNCSWDNVGGDCSGFDESTCNATSGCTANTADCSSSYFDETSCNEVSGCSWDGMTCNGTYFTSCSGTYEAYACNGDYNTGGCTGSYGSGCFGTSACTGISADADCTGEAGCSIGSDQIVFLPLVNDVVDFSEVGAELHLMKFKGSGSVVLTAQGSDKIGTGSATTKTLASAGDWAALRAWKEMATCVGLNESNCNAQNGNGCTTQYDTCSWDSMMSECTGVAGCSAYNGDEMGCTSAQIFNSCTGTYVVSRRWMDFS